MRRHASSVIDGLKTDRRSGVSILDLMQKYSLSKTTVWHHVRNIKLSQIQKDTLRSRMGAGAKRSQVQWDLARLKARDVLSDFDENKTWPVLLAALYWSEGTKKGGFVFTNTDELMIRVFLKILRERLNIKDSDLDILVRTSTPMNPLDCRRYWSKATGVPLRLVRVNHDDKQNKSKTKYGMCRITLRKGGATLKIMHCLIQEITGKMLA
ncbi:hypothetical protein IT396_01250 [Candidatus Nomurabacteria bacterium]|nr:hypothetical protein [Candidatus Nomurabacteria bacterium]